MTLSLPLRHLLNGERAVVLLYVFQIIFSTPFSLVPQAISLFLLSLLALAVEISADDASNPLASSFTTRPGASSGILLGAVTLPGVMLARLILIFRTVSLGKDGTEGLEYMKLQFWASLATCSTVLVFLRIVCRQGNGTNFSCSVKTKYGYFSITCLGLVLLFSSGMLYNGWHVAFMSLWVLSHGLTAIKLIQTIMHMFPACASIGESLLVTSGLVVYLGDMLAVTIQKVIPGYFTSSTAFPQQYEINRSEISIIIQGMIFGLLLFPLMYKFVLQMCGYFLSSSNSDTRDHEIRRAFIFYTSLTVMLVVVVPSWMQLVHSFQVHPLLWALQFVCSEPLKRIALCTYWLIIIYFSVTRFYDISKNSKTERILLRKYYHLMAVSIFVPALIFQPRFLNLAFGAALAAFLLLEIIRIWKIWPLGHLVQHFMNAFTDHRDSDLLIVSHFSLLLGCALPIWLSSGFNDRPLAPFAGILSLGIGDTMASMVGHKYGVLRWSKTGKKTIEGTAAGITSVLAACFVLLPLLATTGYIFTMHWYPLVVAVTTSGLLEAYTAQLDNAFIPLVFYSLLCL